MQINRARLKFLGGRISHMLILNSSKNNQCFDVSFDSSGGRKIKRKLLAVTFPLPAHENDAHFSIPDSSTSVTLLQAARLTFG